MTGRIASLLFGFLFIPVHIAYTIAFTHQLLRVHGTQQAELFMLLGVTGYLAWHVLLFEPSRLYVFGHEAIHAIMVWVTGGAVKEFKADAKQGSVKHKGGASGPVALAPYVVPFYSILLALGYAFAGMFTNVAAWVKWFFFGLGFTLTFHLVFTVKVLKEKQSDLEVWGRLISLGLIYWGNLSIIVLVMALVAPEIEILGYLREGGERTVALYQLILNQLFSL
ncbi:MAG: hypothetical protein COV76_02720 [Candidatus Omnitrophica bacterium CG11_big_fil_rev_8_21_14_0_20_64_10]|nr:MAG: hypothetical protein COV76_02720 [Candidatus Omnitrophica bacterium CG11_big_fil_rev_8_21_14_0_20_64_10]